MKKTNNKTNFKKGFRKPFPTQVFSGMPCLEFNEPIFPVLIEYSLNGLTSLKMELNYCC